MSDGRGPPYALEEAARKAYEIEVATRNDGTKRGGGQSKLWRELKEKAERVHGPGTWSPSQQAISQWIGGKSIGWDGVIAIMRFLGISEAELLHKYGPGSTGVVVKARRDR